MSIAPPAPPYVGPPRWKGSSTNKPIRRIVIHCTAGAEPGVSGAARSTAAYTKGTSRPSSWHYCADARESVQLTYDSVVAYHDGTNSHSIGYELCCSLAGEGRGHWEGENHQAMLRIAAKDVARLCLAYDVPIVKLTPVQVRGGHKGLCGHVDMRDAFPGSTTHWDPGPHFPWAQFMTLVKAEADALLEEPDPVTFRVKVATWNIGDGPGKTRDLDMLRKHAHVIGLQEASDRAADLDDFLSSHPRWALWRGDRPGAAAVPVLYRSDRLELLDATGVLAVPPRFVGPGAGPGVSKPKIVSTLHLRDKKSGGEFRVLNTHFIPSATRQLPGRRQHYADHMAALVRLLDRLDGPVILTGDFNAPPRFELLAPIWGRLTGWTDEGTHGSRAIDHVVHTKDVRGDVDVLATSSDHDAVVGDFEVTA